MHFSSYFISGRVKKTLLVYFTNTLLTDSVNYAVMLFNFFFRYICFACSDGHCNVVEEWITCIEYLNCWISAFFLTLVSSCANILVSINVLLH